MKDIVHLCAQGLLVVAVVIFTYFIYTGIRIKLEHITKSRRLKKLNLSELEQRVYRYDIEYFKYLDQEKDSVVEFRKIIENKDISTLHKNWSDFRKSFLALEPRNRGMPLLVDYYDDYELEVKELYERKKAEL